MFESPHSAPNKLKQSSSEAIRFSSSILIRTNSTTRPKAVRCWKICGGILDYPSGHICWKCDIYTSPFDIFQLMLMGLERSIRINHEKSWHEKVWIQEFAFSVWTTASTEVVLISMLGEKDIDHDPFDPRKVDWWWSSSSLDLELLTSKRYVRARLLTAIELAALKLRDSDEFFVDLNWFFSHFLITSSFFLSCSSFSMKASIRSAFRHNNCVCKRSEPVHIKPSTSYKPPPADFDPRKYLGPARDAIKRMVQHKIRNVLNASGKR